MTSEQSVLLRALAHAILGGPRPEVELTVPVLQEALNHAVLPLVTGTCRESRADEIAMQQIAGNMQVIYAHTEIHRQMTDHSVPYVILKGCAAAAFYPNPNLRIQGDVDFYTDDPEKADSVLRDAGFIPVDSHTHSYHRGYRFGQVTIELHWGIPGAPGENQKVKDLFADLLERSEICRTDLDDIRVPSAYHHGLILLCHMASHMINTGIGLRHLCDWAVFADHFSDDEFRSMFEVSLKSVGLWRYAQTMTQLCTKYLGLRQCAWAEAKDDVLEGLMEDILSAGNFGRKDRQRINQAKLMTTSGSKRVDDTGMAKQLLLVLKEKAEYAMPACRKIRLLLPIGMLYVSLRHLLRIAMGKRPKIRVGAMVSGAEKRAKIYRELRLYRPE